MPKKRIKPNNHLDEITKWLQDKSKPGYKNEVRKYPVKFLINKENVDSFQKHTKKKLQSQRLFFNKTVGACRFAHNWTIDWFRDRLEQPHEKCAKEHLFALASKDWTKLKKNPEYDWLNEIDSIALQQEIKLTIDACWMCNNDKLCWASKKTKKDNVQSYTLTQVGSNIHFVDESEQEVKNKINPIAQIKVAKLGIIEYNRYRPLKADFTGKCVLIKHQDGQIYICLFVQRKINKFYQSFYFKTSSSITW